MKDELETNRFQEFEFKVDIEKEAVLAEKFAGLEAELMCGAQDGIHQLTLSFEQTLIIKSRIKCSTPESFYLFKLHISSCQENL